MLTPVIDKFFSCKQTDVEKKYNIGLPAFVLVCVVLVVCCGFGLTVSEYKSPNAPGATFPLGPTVKISEGGSATVLSTDGNTVTVKAKGFQGENEFKVVVENNKVKSIEMTSFNDTTGIGDMMNVPEYYSQFVGKGLEDSVDCYAGATFTSNSAIAAVKAALSGEGDSTSPDSTSSGSAIKDGGDATLVSSDGNTYVVSAKGFAGDNEFTIEVVDGKITSFTVSAFNDTVGIGDVIEQDSFTSSFVGKGLNDTVDAVSGATFSSKSAIAAAKCALSQTGDVALSEKAIANGGEATLVSNDGNTYVVSAKGFAGDNEFTIEVADGKIVSFAVSAFNDTVGIGDAIEQDNFTSSFVGKGLNDEVDTLAGATFSSKSAIAAAKCALESQGE